MTRSLDHYRQLAGAFLQPDLDPAIRESRGRELADAAVDLARGVQLAGAVLPNRVAARFGTDREFMDALRQHAEHAQLRAVAYDTLGDVPGLNGRYIETGLGGTGLGGGLPLIRTFASDVDHSGGYSPVVPELVSGEEVGAVDPEVPMDGGTPWTIADIGLNKAWHRSVIVSDVSLQVVDATELDGFAADLLAQIMYDVADRGAELWLGDAIRDAAAATPEGASLSAALDTAESLASSALDAPADILLVNPADWPRVRRQVAQSWTQGPAPMPAVSMGIPEGTVLVTGRPAFHLFRQDYAIDNAVVPSKLSRVTAVHRPFFFAVRKPDAIQAVTLTDED
jgi:hypothetical protein